MQKMLIKLSALLFLLHISHCANDGHDWDLAVATDDHIQFLQLNGTTIGVIKEEFTKLKALTFDPIRHQIITSDMDVDNNDTIYSINLTKETEYNPLITNLPDDVQGLAVDPIDDILYWTDSINHTINYLKLKEKLPQSNILLIFDKAKPQDITIDVCRRYIYWTNSDIANPTIERLKIGTENPEIIVNTDLGMPAGITIDYMTKRIYWADIRGGIYYRIESTNLLGKEREIVYEGIHADPFAIAVKDENLFFTDLQRNALYKFNLLERAQPELIKIFEEKPMGLIAKKEQIKTLPECALLEQSFKNYSKSSIVEKFRKEEQENQHTAQMECINGTLENGICKCSKGFSGTFCEISLCHNYCFHGTCHLTQQGFPYCRCPSGFGGTRCEKNCDGYCMNGGYCRFSSPNSRFPSCTCPEGYSGKRCELSESTKRLCDLYCSEEGQREPLNDQEYIYCKCNSRSYLNLVQKSPNVELSTQPSSSSYFDYFKDPIFIVLSCVTLFAMIVTITLIIFVIYLRRKPTPRIKRRYIVNKNPSTSMTERPQNPDQCEITIENCCNMNVCETPCFEPSRLQGYRQSRNEDKKMLLPNMEKTEDLY